MINPALQRATWIQKGLQLQLATESTRGWSINVTTITLCRALEAKKLGVGSVAQSDLALVILNIEQETSVELRPLQRGRHGRQVFRSTIVWNAALGLLHGDGAGQGDQDRAFGTIESPGKGALGRIRGLLLVQTSGTSGTRTCQKLSKLTLC
jgi:hypothetical protein